MNEQAILDRLEALERKIEPVSDSALAVKELKDQLAPRVNEAVQALIVELADIEEDFQIEDLIFLAKKMLRNIRNLSYAMDQLKNVIDFIHAVEPLLKGTVPQAIEALDELEQRGLFRLVKDVPAKVDLRDPPEMTLFGLIRGMNDPEIRSGLGVLFELTKGLSAAGKSPA